MHAVAAEGESPFFGQRGGEIGERGGRRVFPLVVLTGLFVKTSILELRSILFLNKERAKA